MCGVTNRMAGKGGGFCVNVVGGSVGKGCASGFYLFPGSVEVCSYLRWCGSGVVRERKYAILYLKGNVLRMDEMWQGWVRNGGQGFIVMVVRVRRKDCGSEAESNMEIWVDKYRTCRGWRMLGVGGWAGNFIKKWRKIATFGWGRGLESDRISVEQIVVVMMLK
ncbi:hypothetical protein Tco_0498691 [Tanacetum coccineum]